MDPMRWPRILAATALTAALVALCACSSAPPVAAQAAPLAPFSAVAVTFSDHLQQLAASDSRLATDDIASAVTGELSANQLYAPAAPGGHRTLAITIISFTDSLAGNTSVLGFSGRNLALVGEVQIKGDPAVSDAPFDVHARAHLNSRTAGAGTASLRDLYARFAVLAVASLRGVEAPPDAGR
ncbi:MAG TPA: hypothetical protein VK700_20770 [Steroidobacteraceae bacterium]|jgi:hypothetical protein|nr:hypothetical protein [Steroidobacteraceae bacterium]